jgi:hypothetical protein
MRIKISATINVTDEALLIQEAKDRFKKYWGEPNWEPKDIGEAALETLLLSNDNPSPSDLGFEFLDYAYEEVT